VGSGGLYVFDDNVPISIIRQRQTDHRALALYVLGIVNAGIQILKWSGSYWRSVCILMLCLCCQLYMYIM